MTSSTLEGYTQVQPFWVWNISLSNPKKGGGWFRWFPFSIGWFVFSVPSLHFRVAPKLSFMLVKKRVFWWLEGCPFLGAHGIQTVWWCGKTHRLKQTYWSFFSSPLAWWSVNLNLCELGITAAESAKCSHATLFVSNQLCYHISWTSFQRIYIIYNKYICNIRVSMSTVATTNN